MFPFKGVDCQERKSKNLKNLAENKSSVVNKSYGVECTDLNPEEKADVRSDAIKSEGTL